MYSLHKIYSKMTLSTSFPKTFVLLTMVLMAVVVVFNDMTCFKVRNSTLTYKTAFSDLEEWKENACKRLDQCNPPKKLSISKDPIENGSKNISQSNYKKSLSKSEKTKEGRKAKRLPQAIIIGAMKCGTSALKSMISMHPMVSSRTHETHYFDQYFEYGLDWYLDKMSRSYSDQLTLEKSPSYFRNAEVPERIYNTNSSIRLILIVKDPTTRSISEYTHHKSHGRCPLSFKDTVLRPDGEVEPNQPIIMQSMYAHFLENYLEVFPLEQILVLDGELLIKNPLQAIKKVERFLGLEPEITEENLYFDKERGFYCMKQEENIECLHERKGREHPEVDEDVLRKLRVFYAPYNQKFYDLVGYNFGWPTI